MQSILSDINIQQLVNFITVAEQHGFQAASEHLHMTQSAISKSIGRLEDTLGFPLFVTEHKGSRVFRGSLLTEEGKHLYQHWAPALNEIENAYRSLQDQQDRKARTIAVAYANTTDPSIYLWPILDSVRENNKDVSFHVESAYRSVLLPGLLDAAYDIIFVPDIEYFSINHVIMDYCYAAIGNAQILVPGDNPLFAKDSLSLEDIADEPFFAFEDDLSLASKKNLMQFFDHNKIHPPVKLQKRDAFNIRNTYFQENALTLVDEYILIRQDDFLKKIPLEGYYNGILCIWRKNKHKKQIIKEFLKYFPDLSDAKKGKHPVISIDR